MNSLFLVKYGDNRHYENKYSIYPTQAADTEQFDKSLNNLGFSELEPVYCGTWASYQKERGSWFRWFRRAHECCNNTQRACYHKAKTKKIQDNSNPNVRLLGIIRCEIISVGPIGSGCCILAPLYFQILTLSPGCLFRFAVPEVMYLCTGHCL